MFFGLHLGLGGIETLDDFFQHFEIQTDDGNKLKPYWELVKRVAERRARVIPVHLDDIHSYPFTEQ